METEAKYVNLLQQSDIIDEITEEPWLRHEMYILKKVNQHLLLSKDAWLNDRIMDAAQKLIRKEIGTDESYQSVLNSEKKTIDPFHPVSQEHVQLLHDGANHWFLSFCSNGRVQVRDNLRSSLTALQESQFDPLISTMYCSRWRKTNCNFSTRTKTTRWSQLWTF